MKCLVEMLALNPRFFIKILQYLATKLKFTHKKRSGGRIGFRGQCPVLCEQYLEIKNLFFLIAVGSLLFIPLIRKLSRKILIVTTALTMAAALFLLGKVN